MNPLDTVYRRAADVRFRILDDEAVVIRQRAGEVLGLNSLGAKLLEAVDGTRSVGAILETLRTEYDVEAKLLEADALAFFDELATTGLVEPLNEA